VASLRGQVSKVIAPSDEHELNQTFTIKKAPVSQPTSARVKSPSRIPLPTTPRKSANDDRRTVSTNATSISSPFSSVSLARSKTFHDNTSRPSSNTSDNASLLRTYKARLEKLLHKDGPPFSDIKVPNYACMEDVLKANEVFI